MKKLKQNLQFLFLIFFVMALTGCANFEQFIYRDYAVEPLGSNHSVTKLTEIKDSLKNELIGKEKVDPSCFDATATLSCRSQRNAVIAGLMVVSDEMCVAHVKTIFGNDAAYNLTFGSLTNIFAGAATVAGTSGAKTLFSGLALLSNAERSLINETVYKNMLVTSISKKIREGRLEQRNFMIKRMHEESIVDYTMNEAISNVVHYHGTCTFMYGLEKALEEGNQNGTEQKKLALERQLQKLKFEKKLREIELQNIESKFFTDADWVGMNSRIKSFHEVIQTLEVPVIKTLSEVQDESFLTRFIVSMDSFKQLPLVNNVKLQQAIAKHKIEGRSQLFIGLNVDIDSSLNAVEQNCKIKLNQFYVEELNKPGSVPVQHAKSQFIIDLVKILSDDYSVKSKDLQDEIDKFDKTGTLGTVKEKISNFKLDQFKLKELEDACTKIHP